MAESSFPWIGGGAVDAGGWRALFEGALGEGVLSDVASTSLRGSATGTDKIVTVTAGQAVIRGAAYESDASIAHNLGATGSTPTSGQYRWDLIVLRYDVSQPVADRVQQVIKPGTPSTTPAFPSLTRTAGGVWEMPLVEIKRGPGNVNVTTAMVTNTTVNVAPVSYATSSATLPLSVPPAGLVATFDNLYKRVLGTPSGYSSILDPGWTDFTYATGVTSYGHALKWRRERGGIQVDGTFMRSAGFAANTWTTIANIPTSWWTLGIGLSGSSGTTPAFPVTLQSPPVGTVQNPPVSGDIRFTVNSGGGTVAVYPRATGGQVAHVSVFLGQGIDPRLV